MKKILVSVLSVLLMVCMLFAVTACKDGPAPSADSTLPPALDTPEGDALTGVVGALKGSYGDTKATIELNLPVEGETLKDVTVCYDKETGNAQFLIHFLSPYAVYVEERDYYFAAYYAKDGFYYSEEKITNLNDVADIPFVYFSWEDVLNELAAEYDVDPAMMQPVLDKLQDLTGETTDESLQAALNEVLALFVKDLTVTADENGKTLVWQIDLAPTVNGVVDWLEQNQNVSLYVVLNDLYAKYVKKAEDPTTVSLEADVIAKITEYCEMTVEDGFKKIEETLAKENMTIESAVNELLPILNSAMGEEMGQQMTAAQIMEIVNQARTTYGTQKLGDLLYALIGEGAPLPEGMTATQTFTSMVNQYVTMAKGVTFKEIVNMAMGEAMTVVAPDYYAQLLAVEAKSLKVSVTAKTDQNDLLQSVTLAYDFDMGMNAPTATNTPVYTPFFDFSGSYTLNVTQVDLTLPLPEIAIPASKTFTFDAAQTEYVIPLSAGMQSNVIIGYDYLSKVGVSASGWESSSLVQNLANPETFVTVTEAGVRIDGAAINSLFQSFTKYDETYHTVKVYFELTYIVNGERYSTFVIVQRPAVTPAA